MREINVGSASSFSDPGRKLIDVDGVEIGVFKLGGEFFAYENICPHVGGPACQGKILSKVEEVFADNGTSKGLHFSPTDVNVTCPWHGYEFDIRTGRHHGNSRFRLRPVDVRLHGGDVMIRVPDERNDSSSSNGGSMQSSTGNVPAASKASSAWDLRVSADVGSVVPEWGHFINGEWVGGDSGKLIDQVNPATGAIIGRIQAGSASDAARAVKAAADAFPAWSRTAPGERQAILLEMARRLRVRSADFARIESLGNGKHITEATFFDLPQTIDTFDYFAGTPHIALQGQIDDYDTMMALVHRQPIGVCVQIIPWNVPLLMMSLKIAPALACGNTIVLKPAETTSLSVLEFVKEIQDLLPPGVLNVLTGYGAEVGEALVTNPLVRKVAFTGSTLTGRKIIEYASKNIIPQTLELGGKSAQIICPSADIDAAVEGVTASTVFNKGEVCLAGSRVFVHRDVRDEFVEKLVNQIKRIRIGDPLNPATQLGAQASRAQFAKVNDYLNIAFREGAVALTGGRPARVEGMERGFFIEPTILDNVQNHMRVAQEEIFGPVTCLMAWSDESDVVKQANDSQYGLAGGVWSKDLSQAHRMARNLDTGCVWINRYYNLCAGIPMGGFKNSGFGREASRDVLHHYTITKSVIVSLEDKKVGFFDR